MLIKTSLRPRNRAGGETCDCIIVVSSRSANYCRCMTMQTLESKRLPWVSRREKLGYWIQRRRRPKPPGRAFLRMKSLLLSVTPKPWSSENTAGVPTRHTPSLGASKVERSSTWNTLLSKPLPRISTDATVEVPPSKTNELPTPLEEKRKPVAKGLTGAEWKLLWRLKELQEHLEFLRDSVPSSLEGLRYRVAWQVKLLREFRVLLRGSLTRGLGGSGAQVLWHMVLLQQELDLLERTWGISRYREGLDIGNLRRCIANVIALGKE
jgi:hypothetical protein